VTLDGEVRQEIRDLGIQTISSSDFALRRDDSGFMPLPPIAKLKKALTDANYESLEKTKLHSVDPKISLALPQKNEMDEIYARTLNNRDAPIIQDKEHIGKEPVYVISPETWPIVKGIQFVLDSACLAHRQQLRGLIGDPSHAKQEDLISLFEVWLDFCKHESDFILRGGALMDKAMLVLIKNYPDALTIAQITSSIEGNIGGLRKKIKKYSSIWIIEKLPQ